MADGWQTAVVEFKGGLVTNLSPLQQGVNAPGSARILKNFEPSVDGGYRRIEGFSKYDSAIVPAYGEAVVQGSGQTGTTLVLSNIFAAPAVGDTFTIAGVTGTYTIATSGVSYNSTYKQVTLTLTTALASSPADQAAVTFGVGVGLMKGIVAWNEHVIVQRNADLYTTTGVGYTKINKPTYGTVLVDGAGQTGATLAVDGLTSAPQIGDTFVVAGIEKVYTVLAVPTVTTTAATISIYPSLASSPADNAAVTWKSVSRSGGDKLRVAKYTLNNIEKLVGVDGYNKPFTWDGTTFTVMTEAPVDVTGSSFVVSHKNQTFFAKGETLVFTAPYTDNDFTAAAGSGIINVGGVITGLIVFRETLIIFTEKTISQLSGNTLQDFTLQPITRRVGCVATDTIQELGGDIIFLGADGLRLLGATDRVGDFNLGLVSKPIQSEMTALIASANYFASCLIKQKSQYRLFAYNDSVSSRNAKGILGTQLTADNTAAISWAELTGIRAYVADSDYYNQTETIVFAHSDGYVYQMEDGNSFDGLTIPASFATPYMHINDPRIRKTFYKMVLYTDPQGSMSISANLKLDFDTYGSIQPDTIALSNDTNTVGIYGSTATYGTATYGNKLVKQFETQLVGSGLSMSLQFVSDSIDPPYSLDAVTVEYASHDRR
jgi:hypothetical protein